MSARPPLPADSSSLVQAVLQALNVQHNGAAIAAEATVNLVDSLQIAWSIADDPANGRVIVEPQIPGPGGVGDEAGIGLYPDPTRGYIIASNEVGEAILYATVPGDSEYRFLAYPSGTLSWGPGDAGVDVELRRSSAQALEVFSPVGTAYLVVGGSNGVGVLATSSGGLYIGEAGAHLGFFGAVPVAQPTGAGDLSYTDSGAQVVHTAGTFIGIGSTRYTIGDLVIALKQLGLIEM